MSDWSSYVCSSDLLHAQLAHAAAQGAGGHVAHRAFAADADGLVEIELAVAELADAGQPLTQRVEAVGLGLQLAHARGQRGYFPLRPAAGVGEPAPPGGRSSLPGAIRTGPGGGRV